MTVTAERLDATGGGPDVSDTDAGCAGGPLRVLFVWDHLGYPGGATHGLTRYCLNVLPRLNNGSVRMTVCFLREEHPAGEELRRLGVEPIFLGRSKWDPRTLLDVMRLIRRHDIEIVHARGYKGILTGRTAARILGCGVIIHLGDMFRLNPMIRALLRASARWTDVAQGVSRAVCEYAGRVLAVPPDRIELLYNGVRFDQFTPPEPALVEQFRESLGIEPSARLIGVIGRLSREKGHARLLRQMRRVVERVPEAKLLVVGDGPLRSELHAMAGRLGLQPVVRFLGQRHDIPTIMGALDVLAVPSDHEGFSYVAIEALMVGTPVVGTALGGLAEVVNHGEHGILFSPAAEDGLGDGLTWVLEHPADAGRMVASAVEHLQQFDISHHIRQQREIYLRLCSSVRSRRSSRLRV